jgi:hypothetical protein
LAREPSTLHPQRVLVHSGSPSSPRRVSAGRRIEPRLRKAYAVASLADARVFEARGLLAAVLDTRASVSPQAILDVVQALCELAPAGALPAYPQTTPVADDPGDALRIARSHLRDAMPDVVEVAIVMRLAAAIRCIDAALRAVPS